MATRPRPSTKAVRYAGRITEKAAVGLARWATTDHTGTAKRLANLPPMGFIDTLSMIAVTALCSLLGAVVPPRPFARQRRLTLGYRVA